MACDVSLDELWASAPASDRMFDGGAGFPEPVRRYLAHAIAPGTKLSTAVRLRMHGEIKLDRWRPFAAEQVIAPRGSMWCASARLFGLPVAGFDRLVDGSAQMRWKLLGIAPLMVASGPDITRSAAGRLAGESMWLPSWLDTPDAHWYADDATHIVARLSFGGVASNLRLATGPHGELQQTALERWGNPSDEPFDYRPFGAIVEAERTFGHYTIPSRIRAGWYFGTERFERDGEFFRCTIDDAVYR